MESENVQVLQQTLKSRGTEANLFQSVDGPHDHASTPALEPGENKTTPHIGHKEKMKNRTDKEALISIALCTYNGERFLAEQLRSITNQTYQNLEIVVVDDCSTDATVNILENAKKSDPRIKIYKNEKNLGFIKNFEKALKKCNGDFIALSDQDDVWLPHKIESLHRDIGNNLLIYSAVDLIDEQGHLIPGTFPRLNRIEGHCPLSLILGNCVIGHTCLIRKKLIEIALPIPSGLFSHDQWLAIAASATGQMKASQEILSHYRTHSSNTIFNKEKTKSTSKAEKALKKTKRTIYLSEQIIKKKLVNESDTKKLIQLKTKLEANKSSLYNFDLHRFLNTNQDDFLKLFINPKKTIRKQCRGYLLFKIFPFL
jgi:glycosyltransferase involved in cell wall biosynthesis